LIKILIQACSQKFLQGISMNNIWFKKVLILVSGFMAVVAFSNSIDLAGQSRLKSFEYRKRFSIQIQKNLNDF
jgi:hypothetical protein